MSQDDILLILSSFGPCSGPTLEKALKLGHAAIYNGLRGLRARKEIESIAGRYLHGGQLVLWRAL
jgi:hypothetical protein